MGFTYCFYSGFSQGSASLTTNIHLWHTNNPKTRQKGTSSITSKIKHAGLRQLNRKRSRDTSYFVTTVLFFPCNIIHCACYWRCRPEWHHHAPVEPHWLPQDTEEHTNGVACQSHSPEKHRACGKSFMETLNEKKHGSSTGIKSLKNEDGLRPLIHTTF